MNGGFQKFEEEDLYCKTALSPEVQKKFMHYRVEWKKDGNKQYVGGIVMRLAWLNAWIGCVVTTRDT